MLSMNIGQCHKYSNAILSGPSVQQVNMEIVNSLNSSTNNCVLLNSIKVITYLLGVFITYENNLQDSYSQHIVHYKYHIDQICIQIMLVCIKLTTNMSEKIDKHIIQDRKVIHFLIYKFLVDFCIENLNFSSI